MNCPVCNSTNLLNFFAFADLPQFCNVLWESKKTAHNCGKGDIDLTFCKDCTFIWNASFDPDKLDYGQEYENSLHFSPRFQKYATSLAQRLVDEYNVKNKNIIEIGCGKGDFLLMLAKAGGNRGIGFDKSFQKREDLEIGDAEIEFVEDFFSVDYADKPVDFLVCRHVLEHIQQPNPFLKDIINIVKESNPDIFFEVPSGVHTFKNMAVWDIIYEHPNYFTPLSLEYLFEQNGVNVIEVRSEYENQFLSITGATADNKSKKEYAVETNEAMLNVVEDFKNRFEEKFSLWQKQLASLKNNNKKAVIWGSGSKGVTFLNMLDTAGIIDYAVDINPRKQGKFIPGSGQEIVSPEFLKELKPDLVYIMNPIYKDEIAGMLDKLYDNFKIETV